MIVGNGMLAKLFCDFACNKEVLILASGVSNSKEIRADEFDRELDLIKNQVTLNKDKIIVYFGTSSMYDPMAKNSPYVKHKLLMEEYIINSAKSYYIFRISQVIGRANNPTLINFIIDHILSDKTFDVWMRSTRNLIAIDDVKQIISSIINNKIYLNSIINVANSKNIAMPDLIETVEKVLNKKALCKYVPKGFEFERIDITEIRSVCDKININFNATSYYEDAINKIISL